MNAKQLIKLLKEADFVEVRQNGSHKIFQKDKVSVTVPCHGSKDLKVGTLNQIIRDAGIK